jgi:hypothetical protein
MTGSRTFEASSESDFEIAEAGFYRTLASNITVFVCLDGYIYSIPKPFKITSPETHRSLLFASVPQS